ncbi:MAG: CBS domain-containing protein, partial [Alphaproteobacteria bacterium]|nr:CBS domain-containing protein [Alphaproteobacteria bacterium]
ILQLQGAPSGMQVHNVMSTSLVTVTTETTIREAAETMIRQGVGALPVPGRTATVGIVTDRDLVTRVLARTAVPTRRYGASISWSMRCPASASIRRRHATSPPAASGRWSTVCRPCKRRDVMALHLGGAASAS